MTVKQILLVSTIENVKRTVSTVRQNCNKAPRYFTSSRKKKPLNNTKYTVNRTKVYAFCISPF